MSLTYFYKNFNMGRKIDIAGTFIYNGYFNEICKGKVPIDAVSSYSEDMEKSSERLKIIDALSSSF